MMCLAVFSPMPDAEAAPIFGEYLKGLMLLSKTDLHLSVEREARDAFLKTLRRAMQHFGDLSDVDADLSSALHRVMAPIMLKRSTEISYSIVSTDSHRPDRLRRVSVGDVADLYLAIVAKRLCSEFVQRSSESATRLNGGGIQRRLAALSDTCPVFSFHQFQSLVDSPHRVKSYS